MRMKVLMFAAVSMLLLSAPASASPLHLRILDKTGAAFPDVLVIVKSLAGKGEIFRALTDQTGSVPERDLPAGLYRVFATCPYGICETKISEFLGRDAPVDLELKVDVPHTRDNIVFVGPSNSLTIQVVDAQDRPAASAQILVRDSDAEIEDWYKTDGQGEAEADIERLGTTITFVVLYKGTLTTETMSLEVIEKRRGDGKKLVIRLK